MQENNLTPDVPNNEDLPIHTSKVEPVTVKAVGSIDQSDLSPMDFEDYDEYMQRKQATTKTAKEKQSIANTETVAHKDILQHLLSEVQPVNLRTVIALPSHEDMKEKHYQVAVVKVLLNLAKNKMWNLRQQDEYIYVYNGAFWKQHKKGDIRKFLSDAAIKMGMPEYDAKAYKFLDGLLKQFLSDAHLPQPEPDPKKILINLQNGTFEFRDGHWERKDFDPNDYLTYQLPFAFDETATSPLFDSYLLKVLPDECSRMVLQEFAGYVFTHLNLEKCLVLTGGGSNGKSVFFKILTALVGDENALTYSMSCFNDEGNRAKLTNRLLNYSSDTGFKLDLETFKALVSGEPVQARELYCKPFTLRNKVKFMMNCNVLPRQTENTLAYFRRFLIIPFEVTISDGEKDIHLAEKIISAELPGIFNWLLQGLQRLVSQGKFTVCEKAEQALAEFKKQADTVQLFIEEYCYAPSTTNKESLQDLYSKYEEFCKGEKLFTLGRNKFSGELEKKGFEKLPRTSSGFFFKIEVKLSE